MSKQDRQTEEVRNYVRGRMDNDLPPSFVDDVMNGVHRTEQRRRGLLGWPLMAGLATAAAAVALVGIGLSLVRPDPFGSGGPPSPTPSASVSPGITGTPEPSPSASPSLEMGEYGPIWSMTPEEAFGTSASCENRIGLPTQEFGDQVMYRVSMPAHWFTADAYLGECLWFSAEAWEGAGNIEDPAVPEGVAIVISVAAGGDFAAEGDVTGVAEYTVDGSPALRYEISPEAGGTMTAPNVIWVIGIRGALPSGDIDAPPFITLSTAAESEDQLAEYADVLDRMVATFQSIEE